MHLHGKILTVLTLLLVMASPSVHVAHAWSNGGYSSDPNNPDYGTHDFIAQHALDWVPDTLDFWIRNNLVTYLYGTELPDNANAPLGDGIGDSVLHHVYYHANGQLQDDASAVRAQSSYQQVLTYLAGHDYKNAAKWMGITSHYIDDLGVFGHVMGSFTDWGAEVHHSDYETWANSHTDSYVASFKACLSFDGKLDPINAYDAALKLAHDTTFDDSGNGHTAKWMDSNYNPSDSTFQSRTCESINAATNLVADVIFAASPVSSVQLSSLSSTLLEAPSSSVYFIFPDGNTAHKKPTGVGYAQVTDWTALGFVYGSLTNMPQVIALDTNSAYIDQSTGAPKVSNSVIVLFGGPLVNEVVHYYESNGISLLHWGLVGGWVSGTEYYYNRLGQPVASIPLSVLGPESQDMGLIEAFKDSNGNTVIIFSGFGWKGTFVAGLYFKTDCITELPSMTDSWYIYSWSDTNGNGFAEVSEVNPTPVHGN